MATEKKQNAFEALSQGLAGIAEGRLPLGDSDAEAPKVQDVTSREAFEAFKNYNVRANLRADRVGLVQSFLDRFANIFYGVLATGVGVLFGTIAGQKDDGPTYKTQEALDAAAERMRTDGPALGQTSEDIEQRIAERQSELDDFLMDGLESGEPEQGIGALTVFAIVSAAALVFTGASFLFRQFVTRDLTEKSAYNGDFGAKRSAKFVAQELEPVLERTNSKHLVSGANTQWEGLMDPEALKAIEEAEAQRAH